MFINRQVYVALAFMAVHPFATGQTVHTGDPTPARTAAVFQDCPECPELVVIPAGTFQIGSPANEPGRFDEEGPQREVKIKKFAAAKYIVTRLEWTTFVRSTEQNTDKGCDYSMLPKEHEANASWMNLGFEQDDTHPVVCVSWSDAHDYVLWLGQKTGHKYRLLTESEWEYAARGGTTTPYPWGQTASHENANYGGDDHAGYGVAAGRDKWVGTSPVGSFPPNQFGLYDMHGNVMQWVEDCFSKDYLGLPTDGSAFVVSAPIRATGEFAAMNGTNSCAYRMLRGGDWGDTPAMIRSASRNWAPSPGQLLQTYKSSGLGIRVARDLD
ncbi:formylglycine-generating enzyme required for sulfatase activity [Granulicella aggregans]|uniref:Formylglycine-generating enzyme required for sulfatase activity n=1 Tax=Granulicella aggregans TaxID=474949 RepID=A0A7W7ZIC4_9BACT|nr:formylglycine-generating enzyme family protein [Granulicella aggregans]MBB5060480.1 formylglycine-generating enzyme required for sulfatase activity [Granulicella aggregans]